MTYLIAETTAWARPPAAFRHRHPEAFGIWLFNVSDEYTGTALAIIPRRSFKAMDVVTVLEDIVAETGIEPTHVRCDNGPEFTAGALIDLCIIAGVKLAFIDPGSSGRTGSSNPSMLSSEGSSSPGEIIETMAEAK